MTAGERMLGAIEGDPMRRIVVSFMTVVSLQAAVVVWQAAVGIWLRRHPRVAAAWRRSVASGVPA